jgi:hypothetical protein
VLSTQIAQAAAFGIDFTRSGTVKAMVRADTANMERDVRMIKLGATVSASNYRMSLAAIGNPMFAGLARFGGSMFDVVTRTPLGGPSGGGDVVTTGLPGSRGIA